MTCGQHNELIATAREEVVGTDQDRAHPLLNKCCKSRVDLAPGAGVRDVELQP